MADSGQARGAARTRCNMAGPGCDGCVRPVCAVELREELRRSLEAGEMTERFAVLALELVEVYFSTHKGSGKTYLDDEAQEAIRNYYTDWLVRCWMKLTLENPFVYLMGRAGYCLKDYFRRKKAGTLYRPQTRGAGMSAEELNELFRSLPEGAIFKRVDLLTTVGVVRVEYFEADNLTKKLRAEFDFRTTELLGFEMPDAQQMDLWGQG